MNINLKQIVQTAVQSEWSDFEQRHPRLASVLDETLVIDYITESIGDDPEYKEAMQNAAAIGTGAHVVSDLVRNFVRLWLRALI